MLINEYSAATMILILVMIVTNAAEASDIEVDDDQDELFQNIDSLYTPTCIRDNQVSFASLSDPNDYAFATCPYETVFVAPSVLPNAGLGVFAARRIMQHTITGPYGYKHHDRLAAEGSAYAWAVTTSSGDVSYFVDAIDPQSSNWLRFINCANSVSQQNMVAVQYCGNIFYVVSRDIDVGEELLVYYGDEYGQTLGINITQFSQGPFNNNGEKYVIELNEYKCTEKEG